MATFTGSAADDFFKGTSASDTAYGEGGNDYLFGNWGRDSLYGGAGNDYLEANIEGPATIASVIDGGEGDDTLFVRLNANSRSAAIKGGAGVDHLTLVSLDGVLFGDSSTSFVLPKGARGSANLVINGHVGGTISGVETLTFFGATGNDAVSGGGKDDTLYGGRGNDSLKGGNGVDLLSGDDGDDVLAGGGGADVLDGGMGRDVLNGGAGNDILRISSFDGVRDKLTGGSGADIFDVADWGNFMSGDQYDLITDFNGAAGDRLRFQWDDGTSYATLVEEFTGAGSEIRISAMAKANHYLVEFSNGSIDFADFGLEVVSKSPLTVADFIL